LARSAAQPSHKGKTPTYAPIALVTICACVLLFGWEVLHPRLFPSMGIGVHHALLALVATFLTGGFCTIIYVLVTRQQRQLAVTTARLAQALEGYESDPTALHRFENPHLVHCRAALDCDRADCPMHNSPGERCWQIMALSRAARDRLAPMIEIRRCHECEVYRLSCPDKLTELGESFNNLMFLLEEEAKQVGRMRAQMVEKEKMVAVGQIAAGIAHEVGNPLSSISSVVQMMKRARSNVQMTEQLDLIETHIGRISATVRQLVTLARPTAERWELIDIGEVLEEVVRLISFDRRAMNVDIAFDLPPSLPRTYGLRGELQQVFLNLSLNALDAMPSGGRLTMRPEERNGSLFIHVGDTGCGIDGETGRRIFEPFFTTKQPGKGTGLGLAVSHNIVRKHEGTIKFRSAVGEGTIFSVQLPILERAPDV